MAEVYFSKEIDKILDKLDFSKLGKNVAIKVHFGEKGCTTYINPEIVKKVCNKITRLGKKATLVECNVLYKGSRTRASEHIKTAKSHGFDFAPIDILDGELGRDSVEIEDCKIGKGIKRYDSLVVLSHFKGHVAAGFGASLKNVGMGLGSRGGKLDMHSSVKPNINSWKCTGCESCVKNCNIKAISLAKNSFGKNKAMINPELCEGCAMCIAICPSGAVQVPWQGGSNSRLQEKIAQYSKAVLSLFPNAIFINVLENITEDCDCFGTKQKPAISDIGILAGYDIVAADKASLDLANQNGFEKVKKNIDKEHQILEAEKIGLGTKEYRLVSL